MVENESYDYKEELNDDFQSPCSSIQWTCMVLHTSIYFSPGPTKGEFKEYIGRPMHQWNSRSQRPLDCKSNFSSSSKLV